MLAAGREAQSTVKGRIWLPVSKHTKPSLLRDRACKSQLSLHILDYPVLLLPSPLPLASEDRPVHSKETVLIKHRCKPKESWGISRRWRVEQGGSQGSGQKTEKHWQSYVLPKMEESKRKSTSKKEGQLTSL